VLARAVEPGDYVVALVFADTDDGRLEPLRDSLREAAGRTGNASMVELGPRYLHSTGQLHKGGPNTGLFLLVTAAHQPYVDVPGRDFALGDLFSAQAQGDMATLAVHGRRAMHVRLPRLDAAGIEQLSRAVSVAF
jgi:hypothetical protein